MELANTTEFSLFRWHLVFTKPAGEMTAKMNLERQGYHVYFPRVRRRIVKRGARRELISALFPRYLFVKLNAAFQSLGPLRSTLGVASIVRFGVDYVAVPEAIVVDLISREDQCGLHELPQQIGLKIGSRIRVVEGAFAGLDGLFEKENGDDRVTVLLNILGRESRIKLPAESITST